MAPLAPPVPVSQQFTHWVLKCTKNYQLTVNRFGIHHFESETNNVEYKCYYVDGWHVFEVSSCCHKLVMTIFLGDGVFISWVNEDLWDILVLKTSFKNP